MTTRDDQMLLDHVERTVASIEAEVAARDLLAEYDDASLGELQGEARAAVVHAREVLELDEIGADDDVQTGLDDLPELFDDALEIRREGYSTGENDWTTERVRICVGLGGPNLFVYTDEDSAWIDGYWGGSKVEGKHLSSRAAECVTAAVSYWFE